MLVFQTFHARGKRSKESQFITHMFSHLNSDHHGLYRRVQPCQCMWKFNINIETNERLTLPEERLLLDTTGGGSSSSLEKASRVVAVTCLWFWAVRFFRYSCTYTSFVGLPLGSSTLWASSSLFNLSLVRTDGSSRYSGMACGCEKRLWSTS